MRIGDGTVSLTAVEAEVAYGQWSRLVARVDALTEQNESLRRLAREMLEDMSRNYEPKQYRNDAWHRRCEYSRRMLELEET